jgi:hypothetical protein
MIIALYELVGLAGFILANTIDAVFEFVVGPLLNYFLDQLGGSAV